MGLDSPACFRDIFRNCNAFRILLSILSVFIIDFFCVDLKFLFIYRFIILISHLGYCYSLIVCWRLHRDVLSSDIGKIFGIRSINTQELKTTIHYIKYRWFFFAWLEPLNKGFSDYQLSIRSTPRSHFRERLSRHIFASVSRVSYSQLVA